MHWQVWPASVELFVLLGMQHTLAGLAQLRCDLLLLWGCMHLDADRDAYALDLAHFKRVTHSVLYTCYIPHSLLRPGQVCAVLQPWFGLTPIDEVFYVPW